MKKLKISFSSIIFLVLLFIVIQSASADEYFDTYNGKISWEEERMRLDNFSIYLKQNPEYIGYIAFFVGDKDKNKTVKKRIDRAKRYLIEFRKIPQNQVVTIYAGKDKETKIILQPVSKNNPPPKFGGD